jgi:hypothetical protein
MRVRPGPRSDPLGISGPARFGKAAGEGATQASRPTPSRNAPWTKIARCTAVAIGTTFVVAAGAYLVIHIFLFDL